MSKSFYELWKEKVLGKPKPAATKYDLSTWAASIKLNDLEWAKSYWNQLEHQKEIEKWQIQFAAATANAFKVPPYQTGHLSGSSTWGHAVNTLPTHTSTCAQCHAYVSLMKYGVRSTRKPVIRHNGPTPDLSTITAGLMALPKPTEETR